MRKCEKIPQVFKSKVGTEFDHYSKKIEEESWKSCRLVLQPLTALTNEIYKGTV